MTISIRLIRSSNRRFFQRLQRAALGAASWALAACISLTPVTTEGAFPEYQNQDSANTFLHSALMTSDSVQRVVNGRNLWFPGVPFYDTQFADLVAGAVAPRINEIAYVFNQCFGGGMIDELLVRVPQPVASYSSAARHDQVAWARSEDNASGIDPLFPQIRRVEGLFNLHYAPAAGGAAPRTQREAAEIGYDQDLLGPVRAAATHAAFPILRPRQENPQFTSNGALGDDIRLGRQNPDNPVQNDGYRAILFGGSTALDFGPARWTMPPAPPGPSHIQGNLGVNWNTLNRMRDALLAAGYTDDELYVMYPSTINPLTGQRMRIQPNGNPLPAWVDADTRAEDLRAAFNDWLQPQLTPQTQVFFWSSWGHGTEAFNWVGWLLDRAGQLRNRISESVHTDPDFTQRLADVFEYFNPDGGDGAAGTPLLEVLATAPLPDLQVFLNGSAAPLMLHDALDLYGDGSEFRYTYALSRSDLDAFLVSSTIDVRLDAPTLPDGADLTPFIVQMGPTLGDFTNGLSMVIPEPSSLMLGVLAGLLAACCCAPARRRQKTASAYDLALNTAWMPSASLLQLPRRRSIGVASWRSLREPGVDSRTGFNSTLAGGFIPPGQARRLTYRCFETTSRDKPGKVRQRHQMTKARRRALALAVLAEHVLRSWKGGGDLPDRHLRPNCLPRVGTRYHRSTRDGRIRANET